MLSVFCSPSRYTQGRNATASLGEEIARLGLGGPALIVAGRRAIALLSDVWRASLGGAKIAYSTHRFGGECSSPEIELASDRAVEWTEKTYPFNQDTGPVGGIEPLILPWGGARPLRYRWNGTAFVR